MSGGSGQVRIFLGDYCNPLAETPGFRPEPPCDSRKMSGERLLLGLHWEFVMARLVYFVLAIFFIGLVFGTAEAAGPRVLPEGKQPGDARLSEPKDLNGYFPFTVAKSKEEWEKRAKAV